MAAYSQPTCVTVFGGSGFLGTEIVWRLMAEAITVRVAVRHPDRVRERLRQSNALQPVHADVRDETSVASAVEGADAVVNAVGLYVEEGAETFAAIHEAGARTVAHRSAIGGVPRLVHISGIGADIRSPSRYVRARGKGEALVKDAFPRATILGPSVLFGPEDKFLNTFARIARTTPVFPLFGRGQTQLQPVYVGDVADAVLNALTHPSAPGNIYELGGPQIYSYRALMELVLERVDRRCMMLPVPFPAWQMLAALASLLPRPPLTRAQVTLMKQDNVVSEDALSLEQLGIHATALESILPRYAF